MNWLCNVHARIAVPAQTRALSSCYTWEKCKCSGSLQFSGWCSGESVQNIHPCAEYTVYIIHPCAVQGGVAVHDGGWRWSPNRHWSLHPRWPGHSQHLFDDDDDSTCGWWLRSRGWDMKTWGGELVHLNGPIPPGRQKKRDRRRSNGIHLCLTCDSRTSPQLQTPQKLKK